MLSQRYQNWVKEHSHKNNIKQSIHSVPSYKERSYKEQLVEMPKSKEQWLVEFEALKERLSSSTVKDFLFQEISELIKSLLKDYFKLHKTSLDNSRKVVTC